MITKFSKAYVDSLEPAERPKEVMDPSLPGFGIRVHATGRKTWIYRYRTPDGRLRRISLGSYADGFGVPLSEARQLYHEQKRIRDRNGDPLAARQLERRQAKEAMSLQESTWTFRHLLDNHIAESRHGVDRKRSWLNDKKMFDRDVPQEWLDRPAESINRMEAKGLHDQVAARAPRSAALLVAALRKAYNRAVDDGVLENNPFSRLRTTSSKSRDRYLSETELRCVLRNIEKAGRVYADVVMMLLWTAARRGEVLGMKWSELDLAGGIWRIPAERTKNKRPHEVMLPSQAVRYLVSRFDESASEWVFPSPRWPDRPMRPDTLNHAIRKAIPEWKVEHFCPHDIRRTVATHLSGIFKCPRRVLEVILNHVDGSVTGRYDRHHYREEAASSLQAWADRLEAMRAVNER